MGDIKVAIDSGPLASGHFIRGIGVHTRELIDQLTKNQHRGLKVEAVDFSRTDLSKYDIVHYPYFHPYFLTLPFKKLARTIVTIHDLIPLIYPVHYPAGIRGSLKFLIQKLLLRKADAIITISETSKKDIIRFLGVSEDKIHVIYLAPREIFRELETATPATLARSAGGRGNWKLEIRKHYNLPERFVLYVGDVNYNKNLIALVKACKLVKIPLVIVGKQAAEENFDINHPENLELLYLIKEYGSDKNVKRLGFVPDEDLVKIYNLAAVYCQPSLYEGFGLPVLEAMACGCPVVASKTQALVEVAENAAIFANPRDIKDIADKIENVISDSVSREDLSKKGLELTKRFSWAKVVDETIRVYKIVV